MGNLCGRPSTLNSPRRATADNYIVVHEAGGPANVGRAPPPKPIIVPNGTALQQPGGQNTPTTTTTTTTSSRGHAGPSAGFPEVQQPEMPQHQAASEAEYTSVPQPDEDNFPAEMDVMPTGAWKRGRQIGQGAFGAVYMGLVHSTGQEIAVKQVGLPRDAAKNGKVPIQISALESEVAVLRPLRHENIVRYLGTERTGEHLNIFLEYVAGGSISSKLVEFGPLREDTIRVYTKQILRGLEYLHQQKVMHRDIKGANILVDSNGVVKLADFGASKRIEDLATMGGGSRSIHGTAHYMAPEVIQQSGHGRAADIWSLGCVVVEMATGKPPWSKFNAVSVMYHVASTKELPGVPETLSPQARHFLTLCFNRVGRERPNATRLLQHPWLFNVVVPRPAARQPAPPPVAMLPPPMPQGHGQQQPPPQVQAQLQMPSQQQPVPPPPGLRSPPSPIKEESDSRYDSPAGVTTPTTARAAMRNAAVAAGTGLPAVVSPPHLASRPMVPPLRLDAMKMGLLPPHQPAQALVPQPATTSLMAPPKPPQVSAKAGYPQLQFGTLVDPEAVRVQLLHQPQMPAAPEPLQLLSSYPNYNHGMSDSICMGVGMSISMGADACCRESLSSFNPIEEPSYMPHHDQGHPASFRQLAPVSEHSYPVSPDGSSGGAAPTSGANDPTVGAAGSSDGSTGGGPDVPSHFRQTDTSSRPAHMALPDAAASASPRSGAGTQRGTARGGRTVPSRPALAGVFSSPSEGDGDTHVESDQPRLAARPRVSASRRALEDAGIIGGTLDPARAKQWRDELVAELEAERLRAATPQREGMVAPAGGAGMRPSVADV